MRTQQAVLTNVRDWPRRIGKNVTLHDLAKRCLSDSDGDMRAAAEKLIGVMDAKPAVYRAALDRFKEQAAYDAVRSVIRTQRKEIQSQPMTPVSSDRGLVVAIERNWYDWPLGSGIRLGDASKADLLAQAHIHQMHEQGNGHKKRWLLSLAELVTEGVRVRDGVNEENIAKLYEDSKSC